MSVIDILIKEIIITIPLIHTSIRYCISSSACFVLIKTNIYLPVGDTALFPPVIAANVTKFCMFSGFTPEKSIRFCKLSGFTPEKLISF